MRRLMVLLGIAVTSCSLLSQNSPTDSQNLHALLEEVRQLRRDLQTTTVAAQRVQIVLYRLQLQDAAVERATKSAEEANAKLAELAGEHKRLADAIKQGESQPNSLVEDRYLPELKEHLEQIATQERQWRMKAHELDARLKTEHDKLEALHDLLDQLDRALQNVGRSTQGASSSR